MTKSSEGLKNYRSRLGSASSLVGRTGFFARFLATEMLIRQCPVWLWLVRFFGMYIPNCSIPPTLPHGYRHRFPSDSQIEIE